MLVARGCIKNYVDELSKMSKKNCRALLLFSGGLDSMLAAKVLQEQKIDVTGLTLVSYFFDDQQAQKSARQIGLKLISHNFSQEHLKIVRQPKHGHGKALNPCIDCHALMFKTASKIARQQGFDLIATGEVLGQRPFSQNKIALEKVEKVADLKGKILRPLSAKNLPPTIYESTLSGIVDHSRLLDLQGRSRKKQLALAKKFGIENFPTPAGGCLLTEVEYSRKLGKLLEAVKNPHPTDFKLIKIGRHFWEKKYHLILGRNREENQLMEKLTIPGDVLIKRKDTLGPTALVRFENKVSAEVVLSSTEKAKKLITERSISKGQPQDWEIKR